MDEDKAYGQEIIKLDLKKYGLSDLEGKNILALDKADMDRLLAALGNDDISLNIPIPCTPDNVRKLLSYSECRRCGDCCKPNPLNPGSLGVEVFDDELQAMAEHMHTPYEALKQKTTFGHVTSYAFEVTRLGFTRWLPLPCPFYGAEPSRCLAHPVRGEVCKVYPIVFTGDNSSIAVRVTCDYGKDIVVAAYRLVRETDPTLEMTL